MDVQNHGGKIHGKKAPDTVTWYCPHIEISLDVMERVTPDRSASIWKGSKQRTRPFASCSI